MNVHLKVVKRVTTQPFLEHWENAQICLYSRLVFWFLFTSLVAFIYIYGIYYSFDCVDGNLTKSWIFYFLQFFLALVQCESSTKRFYYCWRWDYFEWIKIALNGLDCWKISPIDYYYQWTTCWMCLLFFSSHRIKCPTKNRNNNNLTALQLLPLYWNGITTKAIESAINICIWVSW